MTQQDWEAYVDGMAALQGLTLDPARRAETAVQLERIAGMAQLLDEFPLQAEVEVAPVFQP